ncbi:hypothetical protein HWI79_1925 [Cryptosporidium felis]|nr:hypothetical protein HWI79_1925 [Cryptosporidium felis]
MEDLSRFQGLNSPQVFEELLKCPKTSWPMIISKLPTGVKSELVAMLSNRKVTSAHGSEIPGNEEKGENPNKKAKIENLPQSSHLNLNTEDDCNSTTLSSAPLKLDEENQEILSQVNRIFQEFMVSTYSPIGPIVSRTMYIAGDTRKTLKDKDCQEISVKLLQSYLNIWISLFWNSLIHNSGKKKVSNKLTNCLIKKHLSEHYRQEVRKFDFDALINKSAHKHVGINPNTENGLLNTDPDISVISSSINEEGGATDPDENDRIEDETYSINQVSAQNIDKRFEYRLKLRDIRTKNMSPENYKEFAMLREKNFRPSINILQEWLSITWNTAYNNGLKVTKVSQIPSSSLQIFSFILNDIISSLVETALQISYSENRELFSEEIASDKITAFQSCEAFKKEVQDKIKTCTKNGEKGDFLKQIDFNLIINSFSKEEKDIPKLNYMHYMLAIILRVNQIDNNLLEYLNPSKAGPKTSLTIQTDLIVEKVYNLYSKLTGQILRGQLNGLGGNASIKHDHPEILDLENSQNDEYTGNEEDDMFEAIVESATSEFSISNAFPNGIPDEISIYCYLRLKKVIKESKDPEDFTTIFNQLINEWNRNTEDSSDEVSVEIKRTKESSRYCKALLNKYMNVAYKIIAVSNLIKNFIK